ncbi:MAG TPA: class I SAM-dependent RNA methyltransferase, partial [Alphaproteobacteria bacterium]
AVREALPGLLQKTKIVRISWRAKDRDTPEVMVEKEPFQTQFGKIRVNLPPMAFMQPTKEGEKALVSAVMDVMPKSGKFADLFSGCGTFTGAMLERGSVDAYESVDPAIRALDKAKGPLPLKVYRRDLFRNPLRREEANRYDAIVFDPPRAGAQELVKSIASGRTPVLIGVSCNPATFARDARILVDGGYRLENVRIIDQFTWSHHVELVALFTKR